MNYLGIDVRTKGASTIVYHLKRLHSTEKVMIAGKYREDTSYTQIFVKTPFSEDDLDEWMCRRKHGGEYVGTFKLSPEQQAWLDAYEDYQ